MKSPEKIFLQEPTKVRTEKLYDNDVEYIRADTFIEKACKWLEKNFNMPNDFEYHFRKAMERE